MFVNHIYRHARQTPDRIAVINSGEVISYRRFANDIEAVRNFLMRSRMPRDGVIAVITSNLYHDWVRLMAIRSLGRTTVAATSWPVIEGLNLRNISGMVCFRHDTQAMESFRAAIPNGIVVEIPDHLIGAASSSPPPPLLPEGPFGDLVIYTSGTTGSYKKLLMPGGGIEAHILDDSMSKAGRITPEDLFHNHRFGPWTAAGYAFPHYCWYFGATVVFDQREDWMNHFFDHPVTKTFFVPSMVEEIRKAGISRPSHQPPFQMLSGGAFLSPELAEEVTRALGCELVHAYGGSEFPGALESVVRKADDVLWLEPCPNSILELVDDEGKAVATGVEGIVRIKTKPFRPTEYLDDPVATAKHFRDGYFYPGDMAVQREDARIRILGRVADVLNLGGRKLAIEPFEKAARDFLGVDSLCAFNQQADDGRDMLVIVIEGDQLPDRSRLQALAGKIRDAPQIRFSLINRFPRGENGMMKVNRRKVLELVRETLKQQATAD